MSQTYAESFTLLITALNFPCFVLMYWLLSGPSLQLIFAFIMQVLAAPVFDIMVECSRTSDAIDIHEVRQ